MGQLGPKGLSSVRCHIILAGQKYLDLFHAFKRVQCQLNLRNDLHLRFNRQFQRAHYQYAPSVSPDLPHGKVEPGNKTIPVVATLKRNVLDVLNAFPGLVGVFNVNNNGQQQEKLSVPAEGGSQPPELVKALNLHLDHVNNNCLSDPDDMSLSVNNGQNVARGSSANESWHRFCKSAHAKTTVIGSQFSAGIGRWMAHAWNTCQWMKNPIMSEKGDAPPPTSLQLRSRWLPQSSLLELFAARAMFSKCASDGNRTDVLNPFDQFMLPPASQAGLAFAPDGSIGFPEDFKPFNRYYVEASATTKASSILLSVATELLTGIKAPQDRANSPDGAQQPPLLTTQQTQLPLNTADETRTIVVRRPPLAADAAASQPRCGWYKSMDSSKIRPVKLITRNNKLVRDVTLLERLHAAICVHSATAKFELTLSELRDCIQTHMMTYQTAYTAVLDASLRRNLVGNVDAALNHKFEDDQPHKQPLLFVPVLRAIGTLSSSGVILLQPNGEVNVINPFVHGAFSFLVEKPLVFAAHVQAQDNDMQQDVAWLPMTMSLTRTEIKLPVREDAAAEVETQGVSDDEDDDDDEDVNDIARQESEEADEELYLLGVASNSVQAGAARVTAPVAATPTARQTDAANAVAVGGATVKVASAQDEWTTQEKKALLDLFVTDMRRIQDEIKDSTATTAAELRKRQFVITTSSEKVKGDEKRRKTIHEQFDALTIKDANQNVMTRSSLVSSQFNSRCNNFFNAGKNYLSGFSEDEKKQHAAVAALRRGQKQETALSVFGAGMRTIPRSTTKQQREKHNNTLQ